MGLQKTTFYDSPYMAELYELRWSKPELPDMDVYFKGFTDLLSQHRQTICRPFTLLDVGTGTGRVVLGLLRRAAAASLDTSNAELIGMDNEQNMLDMAARLESKTSEISPSVTWTLGAAQTLDELPPLQQAGKNKTVDLILFPYGSVCLLKEDGELEQFFSQVAKVLTPGTGRAYVSFVDSFFTRPGDKLEAQDMTMPPPIDIQSIEFPGVWYRNQMISAKYEGNLFILGEKVQILKRGDDGHEEEVRSHVDEHQLRVFTQAHVLGAIEVAGMRIVDISKVGMDNIFILQR